MQPVAIHPFDPALAGRLVTAMTTGANAVGIESIDNTIWLRDRLAACAEALPGATSGRESAANVLTLTLAQLAAAAHPSFVFDGLSLTMIEAHIDRGVGMLLRPPSRLFTDHGFAAEPARTMPIRLDAGAGLMGGSFIPPHLVPKLTELLESREDRFARRLNDAELDAVTVIAQLVQLVRYAMDNGLGLYESLDAVLPDEPRANPPGATIVVMDRRQVDREMAKRIQAAIKPARRGLLSKLLGNGRQPGS
ncbi:MAG TPA: hypothetical protein VGT61_04355 [Thermomicrobiales bacterium]|nr:hypothetical protein [Thermomicrobiales bacterium]